MPAQLPTHISQDTVRKWLALAERRRQHLAELYQSGRWEHYYNEQGLVERMRDAVADVEAWRLLAQPDGAPKPS